MPAPRAGTTCRHLSAGPVPPKGRRRAAPALNRVCTSSTPGLAVGPCRAGVDTTPVLVHTLSYREQVCPPRRASIDGRSGRLGVAGGGVRGGGAGRAGRRPHPARAGPERVALVRGLVPQSRRDPQPGVRLLQPQLRRAARRSRRPRQPFRARPRRPGAAHPLPAAAADGRVRGGRARRLRGAAGLVADRARRDHRGPRPPAPRVGDRRPAGGDERQHAAGAAVRVAGRRARAGAARGPVGGAGGCVRAGADRRLGGRRRCPQGAGGRPAGAFRTGLEQVPRAGRGRLRPRRARGRRRRQGGDDGDVRRAGPLRPARAGVG